jgi:hypothetical protein
MAHGSIAVKARNERRDKAFEVMAASYLRNGVISSRGWANY